MELFHGTIYTFETPQILKVNKRRDFGSGFYATTSENQAKEWAKKRMKDNSTSIGFVNVYTLSEIDTKIINYKTFKDIDEWIDFVEANRMDRNYHHDYDIVFGKVADDDIYEAFQLYEMKIITREELKKKLLTKQDILIDQFSFHTPKALHLLKFSHRITVNNNPDTGNKYRHDHTR